MGKVYNRSSVIEFLLGEGIFVNKRDDLKKNGFGHIKSIKNMIEVHLTPNDAVDSKKSATNADTTSKESGLFVCPVTQLETNGMHQFAAIKTCGHVFSEKALNLFQELTACWTCNAPYTKDDVIPINGTEKQVTELEEKMKKRMDEEKEKKDKKRKRREERKEKKEKGEKGEKTLSIEGPEKGTTTTTTTTTTATTTSTDSKNSTDSKSSKDAAEKVRSTLPPPTLPADDRKRIKV